MEDMKKGRITPSWIDSLKENEIFVFGSNLAGMHGGGAARIARLHFGAVMGKGVGLQGQSYAIPTMHRSSDRRNDSARRFRISQRIFQRKQQHIVTQRLFNLKRN